MSEHNNASTLKAFAEAINRSSVNQGYKDLISSVIYGTCDHCRTRFIRTGPSSLCGFCQCDLDEPSVDEVAEELAKSTELFGALALVNL